MTTKHNPEEGRTGPLDCEAWEALLVDALDGKLDAEHAAAFDAHSRGCLAGCKELLEEARVGSEWLQFLRETPPAPDGLVERILAGTSGVPAAGPLLPVAVPAQPWLGVPMHLIDRHMAESRILMTLAMAFFSVALTLNLTGVRLNQVKLSDLKPSNVASTISHQYFSTTKNVMRYYSNLRFVYEVESRLNEMRRDTERPASAPSSPSQQTSPAQPAQPQPVQPGGGKTGGSARKGAAAPSPAAGHSQSFVPGPVLAGYPLPCRKQLHTAAYLSGGAVYRLLASAPRPGKTHTKSERSLV